ncbi:hypothetical protein Pint_16511 [Pistacia integerrima]|uniref:Uncharacterized protein n=1 Tax=Pistacia integerrima TaxID=434235 RepID=A0ACC0Z991_9ROSI|nr:hypothetical protein Pint_16511 [Pistacia integerrima]
MKVNLFQSLILHFIITAFCILIAIPLCFSADDDRYLTCRTPYSCGVVGDIDYPFWGDDRSPYCGRKGFQLGCQDNQFPTLRSGFKGFNLFREMIAFNETLFSYGQEVRNLSLFYDCSGNLSQSDENKFTCHVDGNEVIRVPIVLNDLNENRLVAGQLEEALNEDVNVKYNADSESCSSCMNSQGVCGSNSSNSTPFLCLCRDRPHDQTYPEGEDNPFTQT